WTDIPLADVRALDALPDGVVIHRLGQSPIKIATHAVAYLYVLLFFLIHGQAVDVPLPDDFAERARNAGRTVTAGSPTVGATTSPAVCLPMQPDRHRTTWGPQTSSVAGTHPSKRTPRRTCSDGLTPTGAPGPLPCLSTRC